MVAFFSATTSAICPFCCVSCLLFLLVVFVFLLVSLLLILSSFFAFHVFLPVVCLILLLVFWPSLMFLSVTRPYLVLTFPFVLCFHFVSRLICFCFVFFSPCSSFFSFCLFFSPGPRVRLRRTTMERTTISFCLPFGDLCENVLCANLLSFYFLVDFFFFTEHVFVRYSWNMFEGVRDSLSLLFICCYIVVLVFGAEPFFSPTCLLCQHFWGFVLFCVRVFYFGCFCFFQVC